MGKGGAPAIYFDDALAFPGLINSHDHLELNLFPLTTSTLHQNYRDWAADVQGNYQNLIRQVQVVPERVRYQWGVLKNLLAGVTTVVQHGSKPVLEDPLPIEVLHPISLHSVAFEKRWAWKLLGARPPVVMHLGEGVGEVAAGEVRRFLRWNVLGKRIVAVHGMALRPEHRGYFRALIWCPDSNFELYGQTALVEQLKGGLPILFGTDSTLSAHWDLWPQLRRARNTRKLSDEELFLTLTRAPALIWDLSGRGLLAPGMDADLVIARRPEGRGWDGFYQLGPEDMLLVLKAGQPVLFDESLMESIKEYGRGAYHPIKVGVSTKYLALDAPAMIREVDRLSNLPIELADESGFRLL